MQKFSLIDCTIGFKKVDFTNDYTMWVYVSFALKTSNREFWIKFKIILIDMNQELLNYLLCSWIVFLKFKLSVIFVELNERSILKIIEDFLVQLFLFEWKLTVFIYEENSSFYKNSRMIIATNALLWNYSHHLLKPWLLSLMSQIR